MCANCLKGGCGVASQVLWWCWIVNAAMTRLTTTYWGELDHAIDVLLRFDNPHGVVNGVMTCRTVRANWMLVTRADSFGAHSMTGIAPNLGAINKCPLWLGVLPTLKGGAMTV